MTFETINTWIRQNMPCVQVQMGFSSVGITLGSPMNSSHSEQTAFARDAALVDITSSGEVISLKVCSPITMKLPSCLSGGHVLSIMIGSLPSCEIITVKGIS